MLHSPEATDLTDWRIPTTTDRVQRALAKVPKNGDWWVIRKSLGRTVAEQQARTLNGIESGSWQFGYRVYVINGEFASDLAVRWVGK